ncbi:hypothetical protein VitviT2T_016895 [Vitis vinifera]|uniref:GAG-pre-integrase domain-containing protein n=1 Tax=Vitis vinifera TaxID=29760 RepID=A0ABY9CSD8_VITVI|nr:hypothetical protein VitviT2T_016895 [Vitis vinifera]
MQYHPKLVDVDEDEDEDVVVVMEEIPDTIVLIVIILRKRKPHCTTRSGTILRQYKKMGSVYKINLLRTMRIIVIDVKLIMEKLPAFSSGLYHTTIKPIESYVVVNQKFNDPKVFVLWHDRLGHPGSSMMRRIIEHSHGHPLKNQKIISPNEYSCAACSQESFIKHLQLIARPLLMKTKLPTSAWGHAIMHAAALVRIRPTTYHEYSPSQLVLGKQPNISHLRIFGCAVYVPIAPTQRTKMGSQRRLGVYVGFDSPSIIRYLEPLTDDVFTARFTDCHFNESVFPSLGREKSIPEEQREISWKTSTMTHLDPRTNQCELEVQRIIHLQNLANQLPDAFIDTKKVTKSHSSAANTPAWIDVPVGQLTNESKIRLKRGRPIGSKDVTPRKRRIQEKLDTLEDTIKMIDQFKIDKSIALEETQIMQKAPEEAHIEQEAPEEAQVPENCEILVSYVQTGEKWD